MKYNSYINTVKKLEKFYSRTLDNKITTQEILETWGRDLSDPKKNRGWVANSLVHINHHKLAKPLYAMKNNRKTLVGIELTSIGKLALGRLVSNKGVTIPSDVSPMTQKINYGDMMQIVAKFQKENPQYKIEFNIFLKEDD